MMRESACDCRSDKIHTRAGGLDVQVGSNAAFLCWWNEKKFFVGRNMKRTHHKHEVYHVYTLRRKGLQYASTMFKLTGRRIHCRLVQ
jgi:hypothetical protein